MSEPIRSWTTDEEKQDCEYHGFVRLARRLKETFPHLGICIVGDSLYACSSVMKICDDYNWDCIFTFKEGSTPKAYSDSSELMKAFPGNGGGIVNHNAHGKPYDGGAVTWTNGVEISNGTDDSVGFNVVGVEASDGEGSALGRRVVRSDETWYNASYRKIGNMGVDINTSGEENEESQIDGRVLDRASGAV